MSTLLRWSKVSISLKAAIINSAVVLVLLLLVAGFIIKKEETLVDYILGQYQEMVNTLVDDRADKDIASLEKRHAIYARIASDMSGYSVYNFDTEGLLANLSSLLSLPEVVAIKVQDAGGQPFLALWKKGGIVESGSALPDDDVLESTKQYQEQVKYNNETVGQVDFYYTDDLLRQELTTTRQGLEQKVKLLSQSITSKVQVAKYTQTVAFLMVVVALIATLFLTLKLIVIRRLLEITRNLKDIAEGEGDLTRRLADRHRDEIGELCQWFNVFVQKIQDIIKDVATGSADLDVASGQLTSLSVQMKNDALQAAEKAGSVTRSSEETRTNMNGVAAAMEEASTNISMVASAAEEMNVTIGQIAANTEKARQYTANAVAQTKEASTQVDELGSAALGIGKVLETISEISEQVNLLALNATIEAARAGEAGKGFAVVANEIKELAKQTAEAAGEIRQKIEGIQQTTEGTVSHIEQIARVVDEVDEIVSVITTAIDEQSAATNEIANNVAQASEGIGDVNQNIAQSSTSVNAISEEIEQVTVVANTISDNSSTVNESAERLSSLANQLNLMVSRFKV
jgi:methyl-accepting chemotaxis protein